MTVGGRIKEIRNKLGISQVEFAHKIHVSKQTLYKYENDIINNIPFSKIEAIARLGNVSPLYVLQYNTDSDKAVDGKEGLIAILNDIYGHAEKKGVSDHSEYMFYLPLNDGYALSQHDFDKLYGMVKPVVKQFADLMKTDSSKLLNACTERVNDNIQKMPVYIPDENYVNAAHERTDVSITEEERLNDESMLD